MNSRARQRNPPLAAKGRLVVPEKTLPEFESETAFLMADMMRNMMRVDGFMDLDNAQQLKPDILNEYIRYGAAALQAYREYKSLPTPAVPLREFIKSVMSHADGHVDLETAITAQEQLRDVYERYSLAACLSISRYQRSPVQVVVTDDESLTEKGKK